ncbi:MAG TPA: GTPase HflX, partial [Clostridia bacterium]|nr:GTPase HflX [Clostridia bacterium]
NDPNFEGSMEELGNLATSCDLEVAGVVKQSLKIPNRKYYIGPGKVEEIIPLIDLTGADILVFNNELTPSQLRNIEKKLEINILDRTALILEIFAQRAKTREAWLQVEVAHFQYLLPRLIGANEFLGRQSGGVGTKNKGLGEKKLELDRRQIEDKISELRKELELLSRERRIQRGKRSRSELPSVALVGYTNAGKSTLMNAMIELFHEDETKKVVEENMLFATLDTSVRNITLPDNKAFLLSDTVGFISQLPHNLIKAFRSTLDEVRESDLLLHVVDASNPDYMKQIEVTEETLKQIGADNIPVIYVYNKADLTSIDIPFANAEKVYVSAKKRIGIDLLLELISDKIFDDYVECTMLIPFDQGNIVSYLNKEANVQEVNYTGNGTVMTLECRPSDYKRYQNYVFNNRR